MHLTEIPAPIEQRVLLIIHDPLVGAQRSQSLHSTLGWNDPDELARQYCADVATASHGIVQYRIVERVLVDAFPAKLDGFNYTAQHYLDCWHSRSGFHQPDAVDYMRLIQRFNILQRVHADAIDEVWLIAFPYAGYYESIMGGPDAFWCNAPPLTNTSAAGRRFVIMGFNYERGPGEMLENLGHRTESIMAHVFAQAPAAHNMWERFTRHERTHPGRAECGNVHFAPNSERDYEWGSRRTVPCRADSWLNFPQLGGEARAMNCTDWGGGDIRAHHLWWLQRLPHTTGSSAQVSHNWWEYIMRPDRVAG